MPFITTHDRQQFFYRDIGQNKRADQVPVVLLHGFGMHSAHWLPFVLPLSNSQRFIIPDFRGFGRSHLLSHDRDCVVSNYAEDLNSLINALAIDRVKLAGISMGAFVALKYQGDYGDDHVDHYLHIDQSPKCLNKNDWFWGLFGDKNKDRLLEAQALISALDPFIRQKTAYEQLPYSLRKEIWYQLGEFFADAVSKPVHKKLARLLCKNEYIARKFMPTDNWFAYIHCLRAYIEQDYDMRDILKDLSAPLTLLVGLKSDMYPCGGQLRIADTHKNCQVKAFSNSGHTPLIDQPLKFYKELKRFSEAGNGELVLN